MDCTRAVAVVLFGLSLLAAVAPSPQYYGAPYPGPPPYPQPQPQPFWPQAQYGGFNYSDSRGYPGPQRQPPPPPQNNYYQGGVIGLRSPFSHSNYRAMALRALQNTKCQPPDKETRAPYQLDHGDFNEGGGGGGYPQIYKVDNLIIIANPPIQQQACPPVRPIIPPKQPSDLDNRGQFDNDPDMPTDCTWAVVACCSPGYREVRYNCFELLGCNGYFFDDSACAPSVVTAASRAALNFYRSNNNNNNTRTNNSSADNKL